MKNFAIGASIVIIALFGFVFVGLNHTQADQVIPLTTPVISLPAQEGLSSADAVLLKQGLDVLKKTLDLIQAKIDTNPSPISNAVAINSSLSELKTSLRRIDSTLAALSRPGNLAETGVETQSPLLSSNQPSANNRLASVESVYDLKKLTWPAIAVLAVIVAALITIVLRRKMVKSKIEKVQKNIQEMKEKVAVKPAASQQSQSEPKSQPAQQNVGL